MRSVTRAVLLRASLITIVLAIASGQALALPTKVLTPTLDNRIIAVRLESSQTVRGGPAPPLSAVIRNITGGGGYHTQPVAVALRGVFWADDGADPRRWLRPIDGSLHQRPDGAFEFNPLAQGQTSLPFETGLILPGEELRVALRSKGGGAHELVVRYVVVGGANAWQTEVWLPQPASPNTRRGVAIIYRPVAAGGVAERTSGGGHALVRPSSPVGRESPPQDMVRTFPLPDTHTLAMESAPKLFPVDEADRDASFAEFRTRLLAAIDRHDAKFLRAVIAPDIEFSFGREPGLAGFEKQWKLDDARSPVWNELRDVLRSGGRFNGGDDSDRTFTAPYTFASLRRYDAGAIAGASVQLRARPALDATTIATLAYDVVTIARWTGADAAWAEIRLADGRRGYVERHDIRSPLDYRAIFKKIDGRWRLVVFIAGD